MFKNRIEAATQLVKRLERFKNKNAIILAVPRGGVPIGSIIAKELGLPLDILLSKKIGHPNSPEFAIGSVTLQGVVVDEDQTDVSNDYIKEETKKITKLLKQRYKLYVGDKKPTDLKNKTVIIVDDGIATGNTLIATVQAVRLNSPKEIVVAVPVAPPSSYRKVSAYVDELICLYTPAFFQAVGQFYDEFPQVSDEEVIDILREAQKKTV